MDTQMIEREFQKRVGEKVHLLEEGYERYRVFTPFLFQDGDHLSIVLKKVGSRWLLSDEGHTLMHLSYDVDAHDLLRGNRQKLIESALTSFDIDYQDGELLIAVRDSSYGDALFSFVQSLLKVTDVSYLTRERARSTFLEDFRSLMEETIPRERREFDYHDPVHDPEGIYTVDCRVNGRPRPLFVFAIPGDDRCQVVTICLHQFENRELQFESLAVFEDQQACVCQSKS
ncbi:MAG: DUF1828 domain-containing protein [Candidatus Marsarchaeota archaeon]|nr:DUF1828 domain-containing protein [Candidatus Marsarchaeota archaeon]